MFDEYGNYIEEEEDNQGGITLRDVLASAGLSTAAAGTVTGAVSAERARRLSNQTGNGYRQSLAQVLSDLGNDFTTASRVAYGTSPFDLKQDALKADPTALGSEYIEKPLASTIRDYSNKVDPNSFYSSQPGTGGTYMKNPLTQFMVSARDAFAPSSEDFLGFKRENRLQRGESPEGPKSETVLSRIPMLDGYRDVAPRYLGGFTELEKQNRAAAGIDLMKGNPIQAVGGVVGRGASDFINNGARSLWWLLNAPQAVVDVGSEAIMGGANREGLYGLDYALEDEAQRRGWLNKELAPANEHVNPVRFDMDNPAMNDPQINRRVDDLRAHGQTGERLYSRRRVGNNLSTLLVLPAAYAINAGLGLTNMEGGSDGRKAVFASEEDPTKTDNVIAEVAAKYILGRQGDLLPYDEFKKVRPDVTKDEYRDYKAYRFNKKEDWNVFDDGRVNIGNGVLKYNDDGIDGSEVMFLGRSMPLDTTLLPTAAGMIGAGIGAGLSQHGAFNIAGAKEGIARRETELERIDRELAIPESLSQEEIKIANKRKEGLNKELKGVKNRLDFMENSFAAPLFKSRIGRSNVVKSALFGGAASMIGGSLIGNELERRRREAKVNSQQELN